MATRRERVVLELQDDFTTGMARAAASAALLNKELDSLSKDSVRTQRSFSDIDRSATSFGRDSDKVGSQIDRLSGRLRVLTDVATLLAPAGIGIGAVAVPAVTALTTQLGFAAVAGGTAVLAFQGIGDTLKALDKAALDPTRENLEAANLAMQKLSPAARKFATEIRSLIPEAQHLRDVAASGLFPGAVEGLEALETALPRVESIVAAVSTELGHIAANTGTSLASDRWAPFLDFIAREAPAALADMADAAGNTAHAVASLLMAADPLNDDFSAWLVQATEDLDRWASGLSQTQGFHEFVAFVEENGPRVADTFGAIASAVVQVVEASAPLSGPVLQGVEALAKALGALADSDLGTPLFTAAAALALFNRTMAVTTAGRNGLAGFQSRIGTARTSALGFGADLRTVRADLALMGSSALRTSATTVPALIRMNSASTRLKANLAGIGKGAALVGGLAVASTGAADGIGLTNTVSLALAGTIAGPWGAAVGAGIGAVIDFKAANDKFTESQKRADEAMNASKPKVEDLTAALAGLTKQRDATAADVVGGRGAGGQLRAIEHIDQKIAETKKALDFQIVADKAQADLDFLALGFHSTSVGLDTATQSAEDFKKSLDKINQALTSRSTFRDYEQALDDFAERATKRAEIRGKILAAESDLAAAQADLAAAKTPSERESAQNRLKSAKEDVANLRTELEKYKNTLDVTTEAGRDTQASIDAIATSAVNYAKTIQDPALRTAFLDNARDQYIKASIDAGASEKAAADFAKQVGLLNGVKGKVIITVDANGAVHVVSELERRLIRLQRLLNATTAKNIRDQGGRDGDPATPYAGGGWTGPGAKYKPAGVVHADEFVFSKEATSGNVAFLDTLHRQMRGYADGGLVRSLRPAQTSVTVSGGGVEIDYDRLAVAISAVRPMFGDVHVSGDGSFEREQRRLSALDGVRRR